MAADPLATASWWCAAAGPDAIADPSGLRDTALRWWPARVPGTAAGALRDADEPGWEGRDFDAEDWWFRTGVSIATAGSFLLRVEGIATLAELWIDGEPTWQGTNMFAPDGVALDLRAGDHEIVLCCRALSAYLAVRRARPRWRTRLVRDQNLRFVRTSLLGRMPGWSRSAAPVGPWRPLGLENLSEGLPVVRRRVATEWRGPVAVTSVALTLARDPGTPVRAVLGGHSAEMHPARHGERFELSALLEIPNPQRWWPHTHGEPHRYPLRVEAGGETSDLGYVGMRTLRADTSDGGFALILNEERIFCRGACWVPPDVVNPGVEGDLLRAALLDARDAGMNMVRVPGTTVYPPDSFLQLCDELGILVWQDLMLANLSPPEDEEFNAAFAAELHAQCDTFAGHASVAVVCGGSEVEQQAAMAGAQRSDWVPPLLGEVIPAVLAERLPGVPYVTSSPTGGALPFSTDSGVAHYFGVGAYLRPIEDARRADVRFAAECLAFSNPPPRETVEEVFGSAAAAGHTPAWKLGVPRDDGASWDFEDITNAYVRRLFGVDPLEVRYCDPERALDLARATTARVVTDVLSEWRRSGSRCWGAIVLSSRDLVPGAGWGLLDALGRRKAPWYAFRRCAAPIALLSTDEGLSGLRLHVANDRGTALRATLRVELFSSGELLIDAAARSLEVPAHGLLAVDVAAMFDRFVDSTFAYRFGPANCDVVAGFLEDDRGAPLAELVHFPLGLGRPVDADLGLEACVQPSPDQAVRVRVGTRRAAQFVSFEAPGFVPSDDWFDLAPGHSRTIELRPVARPARPQVYVRALNSPFPTRVVLTDPVSVGGTS